MTEPDRVLGALRAEVEHPSAEGFQTLIRTTARALAKAHAIPVPAEHGHDGTAVPHSRAVSDHGLRLIIAMLAAAKADGRIDDGERERILDRCCHAEGSASMRDFLQREMRAPIDIERVAGGVMSRLEAIEVYLASLTAIDLDTEAEARHLAALAERLGLERRLVEAMHAKHGAPPPL